MSINRRNKTIDLLLAIMYLIGMIYVGSIYIMEIFDMYPDPNYIIRINITIGMFVLMIMFIWTLLNLTKQLDKL